MAIPLLGFIDLLRCFNHKVLILAKKGYEKITEILRHQEPKPLGNNGI